VQRRLQRQLLDRSDHGCLLRRREKAELVDKATGKARVGKQLVLRAGGVHSIANSRGGGTTTIPAPLLSCGNSYVDSISAWRAPTKRRPPKAREGKPQNYLQKARMLLARRAEIDPLAVVAQKRRAGLADRGTARDAGIVVGARASVRHNLQWGIGDRAGR